LRWVRYTWFTLRESPRAAVNSRGRNTGMEVPMPFQATKPNRVCQQCGQPLTKRHQVRYCSRACFFAAHANQTECVCQQCGKTFSVPSRTVRRNAGKYCSLDCKYLSQKKRVEFVCEVCGKLFELRPSELGDGAGRFCSWSCRVVGIRGPGHRNWKNNSDYRGWDWQERRLAALERDGYQCTICGVSNQLVVHHKTPWPVSHDNSLDNLSTLCIPCHMHIHKGRAA